MRFVILFFVGTILGFGDTVTYTASLYNEGVCQFGYSTISCSSSFIFEQFNPALGTLDGMTYSITDYSDVSWGYNDLYYGLGTQYTGSFTHNLNFSDGSLSLTATTYLDFIAEGTPHQAGLGPHYDDVQTFTETGDLAFGWWDIGDSSTARDLSADASGGGWDLEMFGFENSGTVDITYHYTAIPEPRGAVALLAAFLVLLRVSAKRYSPGPHC